METDPSTDDEDAARKGRLKKLVYANLVGASLLTAVGFSASAHGNASSHKNAGGALTWDFDNFKIDQKEQPAIDQNVLKQHGKAELKIEQKEQPAIDQNLLKQQGKADTGGAAH